jgi:pimeloyl-ACP methyl ester carboxylesterase
MTGGATEWRAVELPGRGTTFAIDQPGPRPGSPVVTLLHGWTATGSLNWAATISALSTRYRVVALDHRGHGRGIRSRQPFTLEDCADDVVALLDVLGVPETTVAGYSMGGPIAQLVWRRHPNRVNGLVLCATAADFTASADRWLVVRALEELKRTRRVIPRSLRLQVARPLAARLVTDRGVRAEVLRALDSHHERALFEAGQAVCRFNSLRWIGEVDVPAVVVVTRRDQIVRPVSQRQLAAALPGGSRIEIAGAHLAALTQPKLVAGAVLDACDTIALVNTEPAELGHLGRLRQRLRLTARHRREVIRRRKSARWHESDRWHRSARRRRLFRALKPRPPR